MDLVDRIPETTAMRVELLIRHGDLLRRLHQFDAADRQFTHAVALLHALEPEHTELRAAVVNGWGIVAKDTGRWRDAEALPGGAAPSRNSRGASVAHCGAVAPGATNLATG